MDELARGCECLVVSIWSAWGWSDRWVEPIGSQHLPDWGWSDQWVEVPLGISICPYEDGLTDGRVSLGVSICSWSD